MNWYAHARFPLNADLSGLHRQLDEAELVHRFTEERGYQQLWVLGDDHATQVEQIIQSYLRKQAETPGEQGEESANGTRSIFSASQLIHIQQLVIRHPLTAIVVVIAIACFIAMRIFPSGADLMTAMFIQPFSKMTVSHEYWRLITPVFIHGSVVHIVFNLVFIGFLGSRIERNFGAFYFLFVFLLISVAGNLAHFYISNNRYFGGLSGVVYGYLGFLLVYHVLHVKQKIKVHQDLLLVPGLYIFMLLTLILGFTEAFQFLLGSRIAAWGHLGGLLAGVALGLVFSTVLKQGIEKTE